MNFDYLKQYEDFIITYEKLFCLQASESIDEVFNLITTILIDKYNFCIENILFGLSNAARYNYRSSNNYLNLLNRISSKYQYHNLAIRRFSLSILV